MTSRNTRTPLNKRGNTQPPIIFSALDPGKTEPGQLWIDISNGPGAWILKVRNDGSANWETLGSATDAVPVINGSDPGALGAARFWVDSSAGSGQWTLNIRNSDDTDWESLASGGVTDLTPLETRTTALEEQADDLESDVSTLSTTVSGHTSTLSSLGTTVSGHTTSISTLQGDLDDATDRIDTLEDTPPTTVSSVDPGAIGTGRLWVDITNGATAWVLKARNVANNGWEILATGDVDISGVESRLDTAETDIENTQTSVTNLSNTVDGLADDISALDTTVTGHTLNISTINGTLTSLDGRLDTAESAVTTLDGRLDTIEPTVSSHTTSISTINSTLTSLDSRLDTLEGVSGSSPYIGPITNSTGATVTAATHGKGTRPSVTVYSGTTAIDTYITINGSGDVTWATSEAITGSIVIL